MLISIQPAFSGEIVHDDDGSDDDDDDDDINVIEMRNKGYT